MTMLGMLFCLVAMLLPGSIVSDETVNSRSLDSFFTAEPVPDEIFSIMAGKSYKDDCTVPLDSLSYVLCLHQNAEGQSIVGEMVVNRRIADRMLNILKELYLASYPIERMRLVDYYDAEDEKSMTANNSSGFNFRFINHTNKVSKHGLGLAVDINPLYNPYYKVLTDGREIVEPADGRPYIDRSRKAPYLIISNDVCCRIFKKYGFFWGGDWSSCKDYQHFEF